MLALSEALTTGLFAVVGVLFTSVAGIIVTVLTRDTRQNKQAAERTVNEFEAAWKQRGDLLDGLEADLGWITSRLKIVEARELECRERLAALEEEHPHT